LANFTPLHYDKSTSARPSPCFLYLIAGRSSLYVARRALCAFLITKKDKIPVVMQLDFYRFV
ncbi:MAG: hypothetical protein WAW77_14325, partial [Caldibacillus thermoamylovorans]